MSVIGPRPGLWNQDILTAERDKYNANDVKPGLTGWAQINGRDELEIPDKAKLDASFLQMILYDFYLDRIGHKRFYHSEFLVLSYYEDGVINKEQLNVEYEVFLKSGDKANYYKSDEEIKRLLPDLRKDMTESSTIIELNQFVDSYIIWSDILEENNESVLLEYRNILNKMLKEAVRDGKEADVSYLYELSHMSSDKTKKIYQEEIENMKKFLIETYVEYLQNTTHGEKAYEYSRKLRNYYGDSFYHDIIVSESKKLYNENSFPISEVDEEQYFTCRNIMDILYRSDGEKFLQYWHGSGAD